MLRMATEVWQRRDWLWKEEVLYAVLLKVEISTRGGSQGVEEERGNGQVEGRWSPWDRLLSVWAGWERLLGRVGGGERLCVLPWTGEEKLNEGMSFRKERGLNGRGRVERAHVHLRFVLLLKVPCCRGSLATGGCTNPRKISRCWRRWYRG